ncbi:hypothetical protein FHW74_001721 [Atlantibacter sp. RC6]|nr:hypothetical protein [Atlantibacter sp. RC6]
MVEHSAREAKRGKPLWEIIGIKAAAYAAKKLTKIKQS